MPKFVKETLMPASADELYAWHMRPGAFDDLVPPWQDVEVVERPPRLEEGARLVMKVGPGPVKLTWVALHKDFVEGRQFVDVQVRGPFAAWTHTHTFEPTAGGSILRDSIEYELPLGKLGSLVGGAAIRRMLARMFEYRHERTRAALHG